jgi:thiol-disulfide isomerase/thioredoxin
MHADSDVDILQEISQELGIRSLPTFMVFKDGEKVADMIGALPNDLKVCVRYLCRYLPLTLFIEIVETCGKSQVTTSRSTSLVSKILYGYLPLYEYCTISMINRADISD